MNRRVLTIICGFAVSTAAYAGVTVFPVDASEGEGAPYSVTVDGTAVPLERVGEREPVYYARFEQGASAKAVVQVHGASKLEAEVKPARLVRDLDIGSSSVEFTVDSIGPRIVFLRADGKMLPLLFVIAEPAEKAPTVDDPKVLDVRRYGVEPGAEPQTGKLQQVLDDCAAKKDGGIVYVPPGTYRTGTLRVGSRTTIYLAGGAVLKATDNPDDFPVDPGRKESGDPGKTHSNSRLLIFENARNSSVIGRGTLDANGLVLRNKHNRRAQVIDVTNSKDIAIEGVVLRNTASWTLHILHSENVRVTDVKIIADWAVANSDGIDPDASANVAIERLFCYSGDDCIAVKTTGNSDLLQPCRNITVRDSVVMTRKTALKVGTETAADIQKVLFENIDCVRSSRGIALWARDGGTVSDVTWRDIRLDLVEVPREKMSGQPIYIMAMKRGGASKVENVLIEQVECAAPWFCLLEADTPWPLSGITLRDVRWTVTPRTDKKEAKYLFEFRNARDIVFHDFTADLSKARPEQWKGLWPEDAPVKATGVRLVNRKQGEEE